MSTGAVNPLSGNYLQSILNSALQGAGLNTTNPAASGGSSAVGQGTDTNQLSPLAKLLSTLQQLQQSDPAKYQQVTAQIASNLATAAQTAQSQGNTAAASQLNQLSSDFKTASTTGQLPNIQDLAQAVGGGGHHRHHHAHAASSDSDGDGDSSGSSSSSAATSGSAQSSQSLSQLLSALQASGAQAGSATANAALDPLSIIDSTLQSAGIGG